MDRVQKNAGTAGLITALLLAVIFVLYAFSGLDPQSALDPAKTIPLMAQKSTVFGALGVFGALASGLGFIFVVGVFGRLRDRAPTRAVAVLGLALVGLTGHALESLLLWRGGQFLVDAFSVDPVAARHAWIAMWATVQALDGLGSGFTGASILIAGWTITATGAMSSALGWVAVIAGVAQLLQLFSAAPVLMLAGFVLTIVWLAWGGSQLRRSAK